MSASAEVPVVAEKGVRMPTRLLGATALAGIGFGLIVAAAAAEGYGTDMHALRVAAALGVLFVAALVLVWPDRRLTSRAAALGAALAGGPVAWWLAPSEVGGRSLADAWMERNHLDAWLTLLQLRPDEIEQLASMQERSESLTAEYPSLCVDLHRRMDEEIERVVAARVAELRGLSDADAAGFCTTAVARRSLTGVVPDARARLVAAEEQWATRWAKHTAVGYTESDISPRSVREELLNSARRLMDLPSLDDPPGRLLEARRVLFRAAHEIAEKEIRALHEHKHFDRAFGVALAHQFAWVPSPGVVGPEERKELDALVEQCRSLRMPGGDPEVIPSPRAIETGPEPRTVGDGDGT